MNQEIEAPPIQDDGRYDTQTAAHYLCVKPTTLRNSRWLNKLAGVAAPAHIKMGSKVLYSGETLRMWRDQFQEQSGDKAA